MEREPSNPDRSEARPRWDVWFEENAPALVLFARQWVDSRDDAEDVVQDVFVRFWRKGKGRAVDHPKAYLFASVKRAAIDQRRGRKRRERREARAGIERGRAEAAFESRVEKDELRAGVESALARLPEGQREVLVLKVWGALTFPEIARVIGVPANTAASRYRYALEALRRKLAGDGVPSEGSRP